MRYRIFIAGEIALTALIEPSLMQYTIQQTIKRLPALSERGRILVTVDDEDRDLLTFWLHAAPQQI